MFRFGGLRGLLELRGSDDELDHVLGRGVLLLNQPNQASVTLIKKCIFVTSFSPMGGKRPEPVRRRHPPDQDATSQESRNVLGPFRLRKGERVSSRLDLSLIHI